MATEFRVEGIGVGDKESGINRIMPAMTAGANRIARGGDSIGVMNVLPNNFKITGNNISSIGVGEGMASAYGYDLRNGQSQTLSGTPAASGNKYYFIIAEFDLTSIPAVFRIKLHDNGTGASYTPTPQDNLITSPNGKYNMALYRLTVNTSGAITETQNWAALGVKTISYTHKSEYADNYTDDGNLKTKFDSIDNKNSEQDTRLDNLGFKQGSTTIPGATLTKQAKYAILKGESAQIRTGNYTMSFISKETFTAASEGTREASLPIVFKFTAGSSSIRVINESNMPAKSFHIGFEIQ